MNISSVSMGSYRPAELTIQFRSAEFTIDWRRVWDSMGLENMQAYIRGKNSRIAQEAVQDVSQTVQEGQRIAQSVKKQDKGIYGKLAFEKFMREGKPQIKLVAMPSAMPDIKFTTYMPIIRIKSQTPLQNASVSLQHTPVNSSSFMNKQL